MIRKDLKFGEKKAMQVSLERELQLQAVEELLVPKEEEPQTDVDQSNAEVLGVETSTQVESSRDGRKRTREAERLLEDVREMWEHNLLSTNRADHLRGTLDTWPLLGNVLRPSHLPLRKQCSSRFGLMLWWRSMTPQFVTLFGTWFRDRRTSQL